MPTATTGMFAWSSAGISSTSLCASSQESKSPNCVRNTTIARPDVGMTLEASTSSLASTRVILMSSSVGARSLDDDDDEEDVVADVDACACDDDEGDDDAAETRDLENRGVESEVPQAPPAPAPPARCMPARRCAPLLRGARTRTRRADMNEVESERRISNQGVCGPPPTTRDLNRVFS